ncbi:MAG TPA: M56 family metallopeptidase [Longimicrobium sp.]|jgi:beta-lactamase regulating signal transducer with metallopeptidase domain|uniref:M56 family metallopeptidase n=1 Tax=Longimicrobium sp. TaxID=2029185 RepID=UPI002ED89A73
MLTHLARVSLEGALLAACVWLVCRAQPRLSPSARALLWWCVAAKFVVALLWVSPIGVPVLPRASADAPGAAEARAAVIIAPASSASPAAGAAAAVRPTLEAAPGSGAPAIPWSAIVAGVWAAGLGVSLLRTLRAWNRTRAVVSRSAPGGEGLHAMVRELSGRLGVRRTADVRVSAEVETPLITGGRRPVILVPAETFAALAPDQRRMALCHELAHLKRGDVWLGCVPAAAERCFFFHPLARLAAREYAFWREAACDEAVLTTLGASPQSYGRMLLALGVSRRSATFSAAGAAWSFPNLKRRLTMLDRTSPPSLRGRALAAGAVAAALLAIAPIRAVARAAAPAPSQAAAPAPAARPTPPITPYVPVMASAEPAAAIAEPAPAPAPDPAAAPAPEAPAPVVSERDAHSSQDLQFVLFGNDNNTMMTGSSADVESARRHRRSGEPLLWFRYGGREYVVRDAGVLRDARELWEPVGRIGEEQGRIGAQQGEIGAAQARIGAQQSEIGARQGELGARMGEIGSRIARLARRETGDIPASERRSIEQERERLEAESRRLGREMEALGRQMREAGAPMDDRGDEMRELGRQMSVLGEQMRSAVERSNDGMRTLVRRAIDSGAAVPVR